MAIKRYFAISDNTITNAYEYNLTTRATGSNMGASDVLEVFSIYGQASTGSSDNSELSRILIKFPVTGSRLFNEANSIKQDRSQSKIPASGSVNFYLRMFNAKHSLTVPRNYNLVVSAIDTAWDEGIGLDMDNYTDLTYNNEGSNWTMARGKTTWTTAGSDWDDDDSSSLTASFEVGTEDMELNITPIVEKWIAGTKNNYGVVVRLDGDAEKASSSYYTKKFFGRGSQYFFKRPYIEARWNSSRKDDRSNFYYSSSIAAETDNLNTLYYYNFARGRLRNLPLNSGAEVVVSLYSGSSGTPAGSKIVLPKGGGVVAANDVNATASNPSTGVYSVSVSVTGNNTTGPLINLSDVWQIRDNRHQGKGASGYEQIYTGSIKPITQRGQSWDSVSTYVTSIPNFRKEYNRGESSRIRLYTREKDWSPTIYKKASKTIERTLVESGSYRITRNIDRLVVVPFGTGSDLHTQMSYDSSGSYFDFDFNMLEAGYSYTLDFSFYDGAIADWVTQPQKFKFRVK